MKHHARRLFSFPPLVAVAAALSLGLVAGCGSGSGSTSNAANTSNAGTSAAGTTAAATGAAPATGAAAADSSAPAAASGLPTTDVVSSIAADAKLKAELPSAIQSRGTLLLGTTLQPGTTGLPHAGTDKSGTYVGVDVDLRNAVAKVLGVTWKIENGTFPTIVPGVQNGKYDVGQDNFGVTAAREQVVDYATYLTDGQSFLGGASNKVTAVKTLTDICGESVGTSPGSTFQQILTTSADKCKAAGKSPYTVQYFTDNAPIWLGLANGKLDLYFGPTLSLLYDAQHIAGTKYLGQVSVTKVGFVTAKKSPIAKALQDAVNELIANGDYAKILAKWGLASSGITTSELSPAPAL